MTTFPAGPWPLRDIRLLRGDCARINHPFILPAHLHGPPWYNTIARLLPQYKTPLPTAPLYAIHHIILAITIFCKGQAGPGRSSRSPDRSSREHASTTGVADVCCERRRSAQDDQRNVPERCQCRRGHTGTWRPTGDTDRERPGELLHLHGRVAATRMTSLDWPLQDIGLLQSFCERQLIIHVLPPPPAMPTLLQYYCTTIAQCTPPDPRCEFHIAYNVGNGNIV